MLIGEGVVMTEGQLVVFVSSLVRTSYLGAVRNKPHLPGQALRLNKSTC
jgi:hypothetical protein